MVIAQPIETLDDPAYLDWLFERMVESVERGEPMDAIDLPPNREHLRAGLERLTRLARQVAVAPAAGLPEVPGYTVLSELGRGGMGVVCLAQQHSLGGRLVALKILPPAAALADQARVRFRTEVLAIARLRHPHIVAVHDVVEHVGLYAYAMEWIEGASLSAVLGQRNALQRGASSVPANWHPGMDELLQKVEKSSFVAALGADIADALDVVHREGLLHRDVKPSNILLRRDGTALLSDFGLVRDSAGALATQTGAFLGTVAYASPEQLRGDHANLDARSDVYSLGATLYHALAHRVPHAGLTTAQALRELENAPPHTLRRVNPSVPRDLETIVSKALMLEPDERYASAADFAGDLRAFRDGRPVAARPATPVYIWRKRLRRHPVVTLLAALAVLAAVTLGGVSVWNRAAQYREQFEVVYHGDQVQTVDVAILGDNVSPDRPADSTLQVNVLEGLGLDTILTGHLGIGHHAGRHAGRLTVGAEQQLQLDGDLQVGCTASGHLRIEDGGTVRCKQAGLGMTAGMTGTAAVTGDHATWNIAGALQVGVHGPGHLEVGPQAVLGAERIDVGVNAHGELYVDGADVSVATDLLTVGHAHEGRLEVLDGAVVSTRNAAAGKTADAHGDLLVSGAGATLRVSQYLDVGDLGTGTLDVDDGGLVSADEIHVANGRGSEGVLTLRSATACVRATDVCYAGRHGHGTIDVSAGTMNVEALVLGRDPGAAGVVRLHGPDVRVHTRSLQMGWSGTQGDLEITDGAQVAMLWGSIARSEDARASVRLTGHGSRWSSEGSTCVSGSLRQPGGEAEWLIEDGATATVGMELFMGERALVSVHHATLAADTLILRAGATLETEGARLGLRHVDGDLRLADSVLMPACSPGTVEIAGDLDMQSGVLRLRLLGSEPDQYDRIHVDGLVTLGGRLEVHCGADFQPAYNDRFTILSAAALVGEFEQGRAEWELATGGTCTVICDDSAVVLTHFRGPFSRPAPPPVPADVCLLPPWQPPPLGPWPGRLVENTTGGADRIFLGPPDDIDMGIAGCILTYDFDPHRLVDGPGPDLSVYEIDQGNPEFGRLDVLVSADGVEFHSIARTESHLVRIPGDDMHRNDTFGRSYDLAPSGLQEVRYVRVTTTVGTPDFHGAGFDLDAVGAVHYEVVAPPAEGN